MTTPTLPMKVLTQFCENLHIEAYVPPYKAKESSSQINMEIYCHELEDPKHWQVSVELHIDNKQIEDESVSNFEVSGRWTMIVYLSVVESEEISKEMLRQYLVNTAGGYLFGTIRAAVSTAMQSFGYLQIVLPPIDSAVLVSKLAETDEKQAALSEQAQQLLSGESTQ